MKIASADKIRERILTYETAMGSYDDAFDTNDYYNIAKLSEIAVFGFSSFFGIMEVFFRVMNDLQNSL